MSDNMHMPSISSLVRVLAIVITLVAPAVGAQGVYKYTDPSGRVIYTDDPTAGSGAARPVEIQAAPGGTIPAAGMSDADRQLLEQAKRRAADLDRAIADIVAAHAELRDAQARREQGIEPLDGERQGRRYRPEYWERQRVNQRAIDVAQAKINDAIERRNALR
jgi:hypothetical protein